MFSIASLAAVSPLAEGRELKFRAYDAIHLQPVSPLAEGRELKLPDALAVHLNDGVAPRGGA